MFIIIHEDNDITMTKTLNNDIREEFLSGTIDIINADTLQMLDGSLQWIDIEMEK